MTVRNSHKKIFILNLRYVNKYIYIERKKIDYLKLFLNPHEHMFQSDIKQGYHHVDIYKTHQKLYWLLLYILCYYSPIYSYVCTVYIYKIYEMSRKILDNKRN